MCAGTRRSGRTLLTALVTAATLAGVVAFAAACTTARGDRTPAASPTGQVTGLPAPEHIVVLIFENRAEHQVIGVAAYLTRLAAEGARFTRSYGLTYPSQPNYLGLFAGSTLGVTDNSCPHAFDKDNLGNQLIAAGRSFAGYSEGLPSEGYTGCLSGRYARKHNPWVNFTSVPASANLPWSRFPTDYAKLPTVAFVVPDLCNGMHDCPVSTGDGWARDNLDGYVRWAKDHNSLLIVTFDEDDRNHDNRIPTVFVGPMVRPGSYDVHIDHYDVLRTIEDMYGLPCLAKACEAKPITGVWRSR